MHFLKRIIAASIMLMAVLSGQGWYAAIATTCVDFPNDSANPALKTPGHSGIVTAKHDANPKKIVLCSFFRKIPLANDGDNFTWIQVPNFNNANIYFPVDGRQPTTQEAVIWSCANIDNSLNSPITGWYMQMFGLTTNGKKICIGYTPNSMKSVAQEQGESIQAIKVLIRGQPSPIFSYISANVGAFRNIFRRIAASSVGRVLLYRILIEIRRGGVNGIMGPDIAEPMPAMLNARNDNRHLKIVEEDYSFDSQQHSIGVETPPHNGGIYTTLIGTSDPAGGYTLSVNVKEDGHGSDIGLFHELVHWYHCLRNVERFYDDIMGRPLLSAHYIGQHYWQDVLLPINVFNLTRYNISSEDWINALGYVNFEEIRTVYGGNVGSIGDNIIWGDDLSENLYRNDLNVLAPIRIGYADSSYYEDNQVVNRIIKSSNTFGIYNNVGVIGQQPPVKRWIGTFVPFTYAEGTRLGLGVAKKE